MSDLPKCSIIIPTYNRPAALSECLAALVAMDYPRERFEVIVVDDGGTADLSPVIGEFESRLALKCLRQSNSGPAAARNLGADAAAFGLLAFTDDDCLPHPDWLVKLAEAVAADPETLVGGLCVNASPGNLYCVASQTILDVVNAHFNRDNDHAIFFPSDNMAVSREQFLEIGGFDPAFRWSEDRDFCDRWAMRGWRLVHRPAAAVDHARRMGLVGFCRQHFGYGIGAWRFHAARKSRRSGKFKFDGNFYCKCFARPWRTGPIWKALPVTGLLLLWQIVNTAGFVYARFTQSPPDGFRERAPENSASSEGLPAERASR